MMKPQLTISKESNVKASSTGSSSTPKYVAGQNVCPTCKKAFDRLYNLKVHLRKHTGETPYLCPMNNCSKQFKWRSSMAHHVRAHHNGTDDDVAKAAGRNFDGLEPCLDNNSGGDHEATSTATVCAASTKPAVKLSVQKNSRKKCGQGLHAPVSQMGTPSSDSLIFATDIAEIDCTGFTEHDLKSLSASMSEHLKQMEPYVQRDEGRVLSMVSEAFCINSPMTSDGVGTTPSPSPTTAIDCSADIFSDDAMLFLAAGSDNATDAEMESLALSNGLIKL